MVPIVNAALPASAALAPSGPDATGLPPGGPTLTRPHHGGVYAQLPLP